MKKTILTVVLLSTFAIINTTQGANIINAISFGSPTTTQRTKIQETSKIQITSATYAIPTVGTKNRTTSTNTLYADTAMPTSTVNVYAGSRTNTNKNNIYTNGQLILSQFIGDHNTLLVVTATGELYTNSWYNTWSNNKTLYIVKNNQTLTHPGLHLVEFIPANTSNNQWGKNVVIAASLVHTNSYVTTWTYTTYDHNGSVLKYGASTNNTQNLINLALQKPMSQN